MLTRFFSKFVAILLIALSASALTQAQAQVRDLVTITTRSTGVMYASDVARSDLNLPSGDFAYEMLVTSVVSKEAVIVDPLSFYASGSAAITITANGITQTFRNPYGWSDIGGQFASNVPFGGTTEFFQHYLYIGFLDGYQRVRWPAGQFPGEQGFTSQSWTFNGDRVGEVWFNYVLGGERAGWISGTANHFEMSITAVPEPSQLALLVAGLSLFGLISPRRRSA